MSEAPPQNAGTTTATDSINADQQIGLHGITQVNNLVK